MWLVIKRAYFIILAIYKWSNITSLVRWQVIFSYSKGMFHKLGTYRTYHNYDYSIFTVYIQFNINTAEGKL